MIILSPDFILVPAPDVTLDNGVIGYHNVVTSDNIAADDEADGFPIINAANPSTYQRWISDSDDVQTITITTGYDDEIDYVGIARHNLSSGVTVLVEGFDGGSWTTLGEFLPGDDAPILVRFNPAVYTAVKLTLTPETSVIPTIGVIYVGKLLVLPRRIYVGHTPITDGVGTVVSSGMSEGGEFLGRVILNEFASTAFSLQNVDATWFRTYLRPFIINSKTEPFFFAWRPASYPLEVGYVWLTANPKPTNQRTNGMMQCDFQVSGIV